jgi:hypothetical protein
LYSRTLIQEGTTLSNLINVIHAIPEIPLLASLTMVVALAAVGLAVSHVFRPTARKLALMRPVSLAAIFAAFSGMLGGWIAILGQTAATPDGQVPTVVLYQGIAASLITGFVCFGFLAAAWGLVAVGMLRRGHVDVG